MPYYVCHGPRFYYTNAYKAKKFLIFSYSTFDSSGKKYNITRILDLKTFSIDLATYEGYTKIYLNIFFAFRLYFSTLITTLSHVVLLHGK